MNISVKRYSEKSNDPELNNVFQQENAMIFHHKAWLDVIKKTYHYPCHILRIGDNDGTSSYIPFCEVKRLSGKKQWVCLPFTDYYEPLRLDGNKDELTKYLHSEMATRQISCVELRWAVPSPISELKSNYHYHILKLDGGINEVEKNIKHSHRSNINQALRNNLRVEISNCSSSTKEFYRLHLNTRKKHGVPIQPWKFFESIQTELLDNNLGFTILVYDQQRCISGLMCLYWNKTLTAKFSASDNSMMHLRPNNLMFYEAIRWGCENGYEVFDFGKTDSENQGLRRFKRGWGADEYPLTYSYISDQKITENLHTGKKMEAISKVLKYCPSFVCRILGKVFYRYFP